MDLENNFTIENDNAFDRIRSRIKDSTKNKVQQDFDKLDNPMKRYLLFTYGDYNTAGGMNDLYGRYDTLEEGQKAWKDLGRARFDRYHIYDVEKETIIEPITQNDKNKT